MSNNKDTTQTSPDTIHRRTQQPYSKQKWVKKEELDEKTPATPPQRIHDISEREKRNLKRAEMKMEDVKDAAKDKAEQLKQQASASLSKAKDTASDKLEQAKKSASSTSTSTAPTAWEQAQATGNEMMEQGKQKGAELKQKATEKATELSDAASKKTTELSKKATNLKDQAMDKGEELMDTASKKTTQLKKQASDKMDEMTAKAPSKKEVAAKADELKDAASKKTAELSKKVANMKDDAMDKAQDVKKQATKKADEMSDKTSKKVTDVKQEATKQGQELKAQASKSADQATNRAATVATSAAMATSQGRSSQQEPLSPIRDRIETRDDEIESTQENMQDMKNKASAKATSLKEQAMGKMEDVKDAASKKGAELKKQASDKMDEMSAKAPSKKQVADKADEVSDAASKKSNELSKKASNLKDEAMDKADDLSSKASQKKQELSAKGQALKDVVKDKTEELSDKAEKKVKETKKQGEDMVDTGKSQLRDLKKRGDAVEREHRQEAGRHSIKRAEEEELAPEADFSEAAVGMGSVAKAMAHDVVDIGASAITSAAHMAQPYVEKGMQWLKTDGKDKAVAAGSVAAEKLSDVKDDLVDRLSPSDNTVDAMKEKASEAVQQAKNTAMDLSTQAQKKASEMATSMKSTSADVSTQASKKASQLAEDAQERIEDMREEGSKKVSDVKSQVAKKGSDLGDSAQPKLHFNAQRGPKSTDSSDSWSKTAQQKATQLKDSALSMKDTATNKATELTSAAKQKATQLKDTATSSFKSGKQQAEKEMELMDARMEGEGGAQTAHNASLKADLDSDLSNDSSTESWTDAAKQKATQLKDSASNKASQLSAAAKDKASQLKDTATAPFTRGSRQAAKDAAEAELMDARMEGEGGAQTAHNPTVKRAHESAAHDKLKHTDARPMKGTGDDEVRDVLERENNPTYIDSMKQKGTELKNKVTGAVSATSSASGWVHEKEIQARKVLTTRQEQNEAGEYDSYGDWKDKDSDAQYGLSDKVSHKVDADEMMGENILTAQTKQGKALEKERSANDKARVEVPKKQGKGDTTKDNTEEADKPVKKGTIKRKDSPIEAAPLDSKDKGADKTDAFDDARDDTGNAFMPHKTTGMLGGFISGLAEKLGLSPATQKRELAASTRSSLRDDTEFERQSQMLKDVPAMKKSKVEQEEQPIKKVVEKETTTTTTTKTSPNESIDRAVDSAFSFY